jgi:DNA-binding transcriptional LysR family regulator
MRAQYPLVELELVEGSSGDLVVQVAQGRLDLAVTMNARAAPQLEIHPPCWRRNCSWWRRQRPRYKAPSVWRNWLPCRFCCRRIPIRCGWPPSICLRRSSRGCGFAGRMSKRPSGETPGSADPLKHLRWRWLVRIHWMGRAIIQGNSCFIPA